MTRVALLLASVAGFHFHSHAIVTVGLRYDDCSALSPAGLEDSILAACARNGAHVTFGVVPAVGIGDNRKPEPAGNKLLSPERKQALKDARSNGFLEIALHGYAHRVATAARRSEFAGVPLAAQTELIRLGRIELESFAGPINTFIPPWNAYDAATLTALQANGFRTLSGDLAGVSDSEIPLRYVPATCLIPDLRKAVLAARASGGGTVVAYFHPYEFKDIDAKRGSFTFAEFESDLEWLAAQPDVRTASLDEIGRIIDASAVEYRSVSRWTRLTPPFLVKPLRSAFWSYPRAALSGFSGWGGYFLLRALILAIYPLLAILGFCASRLLLGFRISQSRKPFKTFHTPNPSRTRIAWMGTGFALLAVTFGILTQSMVICGIASVCSGLGAGFLASSGGKYPEPGQSR
ncbi:MAG: DUF2334 domain-containing protein [Fibrobacteria bacterium]